MIFDSFRGTHALLKTFLSDKLKIFLLLQEDGRLWYLFFVPNFPCPALRHRKSKYLPQHVNSSSQKQCTGIYRCWPFFFFTTIGKTIKSYPEWTIWNEGDYLVLLCPFWDNKEEKNQLIIWMYLLLDAKLYVSLYWC